ncbi:MAG: 1-deoxy-D-xylulose-5-phosphate reductoisomerase [Rhodobacteraceae bacterium]|nr:MAG: 1-deoxy-D-xylulose-5-phosphate reductoisomerase [Paracoccaceae bacterium]
MDIIIFGATGSIGQNALEVIRSQSKNHSLQVRAITGNDNIDQLCKDAIEFKVERVVTASHKHMPELKDRLSSHGIEVCAGTDAILETAQMKSDWILSAIIGFHGVPPTLEAIKYCRTVAIANKESLVCAGKIANDTAKMYGTTLLPVDSEHNAIFQCLQGEDISTVRKVTLTASGGPFLNCSLREMENATLDQALAHPTWSMGKRISIDSATMFNKALELIEAKYFFNLNGNQLDVIIHPESIIHSMVSFHDNSTLAQLGPHDMKYAIAYTMNYPDRKSMPLSEIDFATQAKLTFQAVDHSKFPALRLARWILKTDGGLGAVFNAAKEVALDRFISGEIGFLDMTRLVEKVLMMPDITKLEYKIPESLDEVKNINSWTRQITNEIKLNSN